MKKIIAILIILPLVGHFLIGQIISNKPNHKNSSFSFYYSFEGLGSNRWNPRETVRISNQALVYTIEQNTSILTKDHNSSSDTILQQPIDENSIINIWEVVKGLGDTTIFETNPCIKSGGVHTMIVSNEESTIKFILMNTFEKRALEIVAILNAHLPKERKLWPSEKLILDEEKCWDLLDRINKK